MSASVRELILEAILAALTAPGGPTGLTVQRFATYPADPAKLPMVKFYWVSDASEWMPPIGASQAVKQRMQVAFECYAAGTAQDGSATDAAADALLQWVEQQLFLDPRFGGLAMYPSPIKTDAAAVAEDRSYIRCDALYEVFYARRPGDLTTRA